jgi:hypothetical protein
MDLITGGIGFVIGAVASTVALFRSLASRLSPEEVTSIRIRIATAIKDYNEAAQDGSLSTDEKIKLAEDALALIQEILKDLES